MLNICQDTLPHSSLTYLAFRLSCVETLTLIEFARRMPGETFEPFGYLTEVPFLREVAPHVQIALLASTWAKHMDPGPVRANLVDESVVYAVSETAARIVERMPELVVPFLENGPRRLKVPVDHVLATELRSLHLRLANEGDFLLISQLQDLPPDECQEFKRQFHLFDAYLEPLFDVLGQWSVGPDLMTNLVELLTPQEIEEFHPILKTDSPAVDR